MSTQTRNALIQLLESAMITAIIAGLVALQPILAGTGAIDWRQAGIAFGYAAVFSLAMSLAVYLKGSNSALSTAIQAIVDELEQRAAQQVITPDQSPQTPNRATMTVDMGVASEHPPLSPQASMPSDLPPDAKEDMIATAPKLPVVPPGQS